jgi:hypothetical protein
VDTPEAPSINPSPQLVVITLQEWDAARREISTLWDCHRMIREMACFVFTPDEVTDEQRGEMTMSLQHFFRTYGSEDG